MTQLSLASTPELRDGVEVFLYPQKGESCQILFLFLSSRRRLRITCKPSFSALLKELSKPQTLGESLTNSGLTLDAYTSSFLSFLEEEGIITMSNPLETLLLPKEYVEQYKRQVYFLLDVLKSPQLAHAAQKKIFDAHIALFGLGAVGSTLLQQLCMMGFRKFTLIDYATVENNDIARTPYHIESQVKSLKVQAARNLVEDHAFDPIVFLHNTTLKTHTNLDILGEKISLIANTADEPYIGYTNIKLSRYALQHNIPIVAAGGFDAHLASLGELLIPHMTPCADCYATFFHERLKNWRPIPHPVKDREGWFGGLGSLSTFSASAAALEILFFIISSGDQQVSPGKRGEFLFHDYSLDTFVVDRDTHCRSCGTEKS